MDIYERYVKEREGLDCYRIDDIAFIHYKFFIGDEGVMVCYISDYYVMPEKRRQGIGYKLADHVFTICKERNIKNVFCQSIQDTNTHKMASESIKNYGFEPIDVDGKIIHYVMGVEKWAKDFAK